MSGKTYRKLGIINADQVPNWERIQPKWDELVEDVLKLTPGQALVVEFDTEEEAKRARNAVRVRANERLRNNLIRTRVVTTDEGKYEVSLIRSYDLNNE